MSTKTSCEERISYTPGPWQVAGQFPHVTFVAVRDGAIARCDNGQDDARAPGGFDHAANARLIAAAPELLTALKAVREFMDDPARECPLPVEIASAVREAIVKAEGRS